MSFLPFQRFVFESSDLGPLGSALVAGFAVVILGTPYLTEAGERYLEELEEQ